MDRFTEPFEAGGRLAPDRAEMAGRAADRGVQSHGGSGYIHEFPVERFYRDARVLLRYEGTTQMQQIIIGRSLGGRN